MSTWNTNTNELIAEDKVLYQYATAPSLTWTVTDVDGSAIDVSASGMLLNVYRVGTSTAIYTRTTASGHITAVSNAVTCTYTATETALAETFRYSLVDTTSVRLLAHGAFEVRKTVFTAAA